MNMKMEETSSKNEDTHSIFACTTKRLKYGSLIVLTFLNVTVVLSMRYSRTRSQDMFLEGTAVLMAEIMKLFTCLCLSYNSPDEGDRDIRKLISFLHRNIIINKVDTIKVCLPSFMYIIHNNLMYIAADHLDMATYQITYQLKIMTTAIFTVLILKRMLNKVQWVSLVFLCFGVAMVQISSSEDTISLVQKQTRTQYRSLGFLAALAGCVISALAAICFEKILKGSNVSLWMRNIQLSLLGIPLGLFTAFAHHFQDIKDKGFFFGYDLFVLYIVALHATYGLMVAVVVKYADNIFKGFAHSLAVVITCFMSIFIFGRSASLQFVVGAGLVVVSIIMYGGYRPNSSYLPFLIQSKTIELKASKEEEKV